MSSSFGSDIHRLLQAAEDGQRADILTYSSGHLGPRSLSQSQPHREPTQPFWTVSQSQGESPNPLILQQTQTKALTYIKKKGIKESPSETSTGTASLESQVVMSRRDQAPDHSSCAGIKERASPPKIVHRSSDSLRLRPRAFSQKKSNSSSDPEEKQKSCSSRSDQEGSNSKEGQLQMTQRVGRQVLAKQGLWAGGNVAEIHERKLEKELKKLPVQSWPSRDRLAVFSDVFDDVCEDSPVFGRILREIKTEYDLYVDHMMASQSSLHDQVKHTVHSALNASVKDDGTLEEAEMKVCRLEQEARGALEENKRVRNELQTVPAIESPEDMRSKTQDYIDTSLSALQDGGTASGCTDSVQSKRLEVLNMWREIRQLEEEINKKLVSSVTTTANERHMKELKTEVMRLIASNNRLNTTNKDLENNINTVLNREKASKAIRRMLWDEIHCDLQTE
ncbi:uncharacterized protein C6orf118-like [Pempheris klunzingeri]|uniref:uncharacterized protein C6orf118-like n=1 Tax=Pempheris klunzingeri TaxID=3127111 RepID=UPI00397FC503